MDFTSVAFKKESQGTLEVDSVAMDVPVCVE